MGEADGDLLEVVGDEEHRGRARGRDDLGEGREELLAAGDVEAGGGLVKDEELRVRHEGAGDLDALALTLDDQRGFADLMGKVLRDLELTEAAPPGDQDIEGGDEEEGDDTAGASVFDEAQLAASKSTGKADAQKEGRV